MNELWTEVGPSLENTNEMFDMKIKIVNQVSSFYLKTQRSNLKLKPHCWIDESKRLGASSVKFGTNQVQTENDRHFW